jgi:hypothetical protein
LGTVKHYYKFETWKLGQEFHTRHEGRISAVQFAPAELSVAESWVTQTLQITTGQPAGVYFGATSEAIRYPDLRNPGFYQRTTYAYNPTLQGGTQYGQTTDSWEYDSAALVRHAQSTYSMNTPNWTLRKTIDRLYDGAGQWVSEQRLYYNTQGDLTFAQDLNKADGSLTKDSTIGYDLLGNVISQTELTSSGTISNPTDAGRSGNTTRYAYDWKFGYYLYTQTNALNQPAVYLYYGVNEGTPLAGQPFGALRAVRDPNSNQPGNGTIDLVFAQNERTFIHKSS